MLTTNRLTSISGGPPGYNFNYSYDTQGNIIQRGAQGYVFDQGNRMKSATGKATYIYDGLGHRVSVVGTDSVNRVQVYSQEGQLLYAGPTGGTGTKYIYLRQHVIAEVGSGGTTYDHTDGLGSPVAQTNATGAILNRTRYEPYGYIAAGSPRTIGFTGHVNDNDTSLIYMQQRYYDSFAGRMLSIDPVTTNENTGSSFNRYVYGKNNPFKYVDPDGRQVIIIVGKREGPDPFVVPNLAATSKPAGDPITRAIAKAIFGNNTAAPPPEDEERKEDPKPVKRVSNPKHHSNSQSPEPKNAQELFDKARVDRNGVRWSADENGNIHRFSKESNGESHWNGSTAGTDPIKEQNIPAEIKRAFWR
jgi:RHS repeat-associated protein